MTTLTEALTATLARRDADELAAAREEQRELDVRAADRWFASVPPPNQSPAAAIRATPLDATPLADELAALRAEVARLAPFERAASYWKDNHDREKNAHAGTAASHAALRADLQHALGVRDAAMEAEDQAVAERDATRRLYERECAEVAKAQEMLRTLRAQRDAAVEALAEAVSAFEERIAFINHGPLIEKCRAALLLARGTP